MITPQWSYLDFFAGGGMAGKGLGDQWRCLFANDIDPKKARSYEANFPGEEVEGLRRCRSDPGQSADRPSRLCKLSLRRCLGSWRRRCPQGTALRCDLSVS